MLWASRCNAEVCYKRPSWQLRAHTTAGRKWRLSWVQRPEGEMASPRSQGGEGNQSSCPRDHRVSSSVMTQASGEIESAEGESTRPAPGELCTPAPWHCPRHRSVRRFNFLFCKTGSQPLACWSELREDRMRREPRKVLESSLWVSGTSLVFSSLNRCDSVDWKDTSEAWHCTEIPQGFEHPD